jgi:hypothetical protein
VAFAAAEGNPSAAAPSTKRIIAVLVRLGYGYCGACEAAPTISLGRGAAAGAIPCSSPCAQTAQCEHLRDCFIDPFDRPGDAILSQRRGLLIVQ